MKAPNEPLPPASLLVLSQHAILCHPGHPQWALQHRPLLPSGSLGTGRAVGHGRHGHTNKVSVLTSERFPPASSSFSQLQSQTTKAPRVW